MYRCTRFLLVCCFVLVVVARVSAQTVGAELAEDRGSQPIVITGTNIRDEDPLAFVTVISRDEIDARQELSVLELLRQVPGLHVDQRGGPGGVSSVYLRGADPNTTVVLIDGVKVNDPTNSRGGSFDFSTLSTDNIERIEIARGPLSSVYGTDAMAGVIQIVTRRRQSGARSSVGVAGGAFEQFQTRFATSGAAGDVDYSFGGSVLDVGEVVSESESQRWNALGSVGVAMSDKAELRLQARLARAENESFPDDSGGPQFAALREREVRDIDEASFGFDLSHKHTSILATALSGSVYKRDEEIDSPGVAPGFRDPFGIPANTSDTAFRRAELKLRNTVVPLDELKFAFGGQAQFEKGRERGTLLFGDTLMPTRFELSRTIWSLFLESKYFLSEAFALQGGGQIDFASGESGEVSPRVSLSYDIPHSGLKVLFAWAEGFKLPSMFALGNPIVGNPALEPETSRGFDLGLSQSFWGTRGQLGVNLFHTRYNEAIDFEEGPPPRLVNRSKIVTKGIELNLALQASPQLELSSHLSYVDADVRASDERLRNRPSWRAGALFAWLPRRGVRLHLDALFVGRVFDSSIPTGARELDEYVRIDFAATWQVTSVWKCHFAIDNVTDADYEEFIGFEAAGITPRAGVVATF